MAQSVNINQRIVLIGGDDARKQLEAVAKAGEDLGQRLQRETNVGNAGLQTFTRGLRETEKSANQLKYAQIDLGYQISHIADAVSAGISPFRALTSEAGKLVETFRLGGGVGNVLGAFTKGILSWISPSALAVAGLAGIAAGIGFLLNRIRESEDRVRTFGAQLKALGYQVPGQPGGVPTVLRGGEGTPGFPAGQRLIIPANQVTPQQLSRLAESYRDLGLNADVASKAISGVIQAGVNPAFAGQIIRIGQETNILFGTSGMIERLTQAAKSVPDLQKFAQDVYHIDTTNLTNVPVLLNAIGDRAKYATESLDPFDRKWLLLKSHVSGAIDATARFFEEGLVNANETKSAFSELVDSLTGAIQRGEFTKIATVFSGAFKPPDTRQFLSGLFEDTRRVGIELYEALGGGIDKVSGKFSSSFSNLPRVINSLLDTVTLPSAKISQDLGRAIGSVLPTAVSTAFEGLQKVVGGLENSLVGIWGKFQSAALSAIGYVQGILNDLLNLANKFFGSGGKPVASASTPPATSYPGVPDVTQSGFARGGMFRGVGSGTSDSNLIRISDGEYIVNAIATRANLPLLNAINSIGRPIRSSRGFAAGGLAQVIANQTGPGGNIGEDQRTRFTLVIEGRPYTGLTAPEETASSLVQHARTSSILSLGASPGWKR